MFWTATPPAAPPPHAAACAEPEARLPHGRYRRRRALPTAAGRINGTHWHVPVHGWIFKPELESRKRRLAVRGLGRLFRVSDAGERRLLARRVMPFAADNKSMRYVRVRFGARGRGGRGEGKGEGGAVHRLPRSAKDGYFVGHLQLRDDQLGADADGIARYEAVVDSGGRTFAGAVHLVPPTGTSIISDIDDTVSSRCSGYVRVGVSVICDEPVSLECAKSETRGRGPR